MGLFRLLLGLPMGGCLCSGPEFDLLVLQNALHASGLALFLFLASLLVLTMNY